mmetsp:Transcript_33057/g.104592  ORF Transcript_33057/g.104592 Transcript_33057/m.104592 type:complete len:254 (-) Transcript_33057:78-839(-)
MLHDILQHVPLVQPEAPRKVRHSRIQQHLREVVGYPRCELTLQIPSSDTPAAAVPRAGNDVGVGAGLRRDKLRDELGMVAHVGIHKDDVVSLGLLQAIHVGRAEPELALARQNHDAIRAVDALQLLRHGLRAVRAVVLHDDDLIVHSFPDVLLQQPHDERQVVALVVRREDDGVGRHGAAPLNQEPGPGGWMSSLAAIPLRQLAGEDARKQGRSGTQPSGPPRRMPEPRGCSSYPERRAHRRRTGSTPHQRAA